MTLQEQDVSAARAAARELQRAVDSLRTHFGDSLDLTRLIIDAKRVQEDLDLLAGQELEPAPPRLEVIEDREYPADMWADAEGEGMSPS
jgi:hypothetical protein